MKWPSSCRYYMSVCTWPVRTRNRLATFPRTGPPQIRKVCAVFLLCLSLSITHTLSTGKLLLCRTRSAVADKWTRSNKDHLPENTKIKNKIKKICIKKKKLRLHLSLDDDLPPLISWKKLARHLTDHQWHTVSGVYCYFSFNSHNITLRACFYSCW